MESEILLFGDKGTNLLMVGDALEYPRAFTWKVSVLLGC